MIKNQKQVSVTKERLEELRKGLLEWEDREKDKSSLKYLMGKYSLNSLIEDLQRELNEYEGLCNGNFHILNAKSLNDIPKVLIGARLAQKFSQKDLGELVGLKEQQIQRYESTDYETASWPRIVEIAFALNLKLPFEKIIIMNKNNEDDFEYPNDITKDQVEFASNNIKNRKSLIL